MSRSLVRELIPHLPDAGLYVEPEIPFKKLHNAIEDYARSVKRGDVIALYDATLMGSGKDGALFLADRFVFQNNNLQPAHEIKYHDLVQVVQKKSFIGGPTVDLDVNRGRATVHLSIDFSGKAKAAPYVSKFLEEALLLTAEAEAASRDLQPGSGQTNAGAVQRALEELVEKGQLTEEDFMRLMQVL